MLNRDGKYLPRKLQCGMQQGVRTGFDMLGFGPFFFVVADAAGAGDENH